MDTCLWKRQESCFINIQAKKAMGSKHKQIRHFDNIPFAKIGKFRYRDKEKQMKILHLFTRNWIRTSPFVGLQPQGFLITKLAWSNHSDPQNAVQFVCWNSRNKWTKQMNTSSVATKENKLRIFEAHLLYCHFQVAGVCL